VGIGNKFVPNEIASWARQRYADYKAGKVPEDVMCGGDGDLASRFFAKKSCRLPVTHFLRNLSRLTFCGDEGIGATAARVGMRGVGRVFFQSVDHSLRDAQLRRSAESNPLGGSVGGGRDYQRPSCSSS